MNVTFGPARNNAHNYSRDKALLSGWSVVAIRRTANEPPRIAELLVARTYGALSGRGSRVYASVWLHSGLCSHTGRGHASGGGYHKPSAAISSALSDANIALSESIEGRGDGAIEEALLAVARTAHPDCEAFAIVRYA